MTSIESTGNTMCVHRTSSELAMPDMKEIKSLTDCSLIRGANFIKNQELENLLRTLSKKLHHTDPVVSTCDHLVLNIKWSENIAVTGEKYIDELVVLLEKIINSTFP
eukprot:TRINITY_DN10946_c0_g1_i1.p1 TRINITY_DN10946_c0_g1~~TRINITY_DN10946_c0_g1_i1.p1  ORF type:complete len:107 (-),score=11.25 TRINITY_DN10946_c0_g1_i1:151-471(-)